MLPAKKFSPKIFFPIITVSLNRRNVCGTISSKAFKTADVIFLEQHAVAAWVAANVKTIFAYSLSRLQNRQDAEDLAGEIIAQMLSCGRRAAGGETLNGYLWAIANNTYKKFLRAKKGEPLRFDETFVGVYWGELPESPAESVENRERLSALRRELSLLGAQYRQATVSYYIYNKPCSEIAAEMHVSTEMVKYYLFKARHLLKEGIDMVREPGEKSYNPGIFRMDYWGSGNNGAFWNLFSRRLPGNILLSAYRAPRTVPELSAELGVSAPYLEDEIKILEKFEMLKELGNGKVQTNIIIFTDEFEKKLNAKIAPACEKLAESLTGRLKALVPDFRKIEFNGRAYSENRLLWAIVTLTMDFARILADKRLRESFGEYPLLCNGGRGYVYGYDNDYKNHHYNGIYGQCDNRAGDAYFSAYNYRVIQNSQLWEPGNWNDCAEAVNAAVLGREAPEDNEMLVRMIEQGFVSSDGGRLSANFPVFTLTQYNAVRERLRPAAEETAAFTGEICREAGKLLETYVPEFLRDRCGTLAFIKYEMDVPAFIAESLVKCGFLGLSQTNEKLAMFGVIRKK